MLSKKIFSNPSLATPSKQNEAKKISYWLEKLFKQEKAQIVAEQSGSQSNTNSTLTSLPDEQVIEKSSEEKGLDEAVKSQFKKTEGDRQTLEDMVNNSNRILASISSVFPWDIFPNTINAEATRLTIIHHQLFSSQVYSVDIKNISNVFINTGLFFAELTIVSSTFAENEVRINNLRKKEAIHLRRIIEGLRMFVEKNIDTTSYTVKELTNKLRELSSTKIVL